MDLHLLLCHLAAVIPLEQHLPHTRARGAKNSIKRDKRSNNASFQQFSRSPGLGRVACRRLVHVIAIIAVIAAHCGASPWARRRRP